MAEDSKKRNTVKVKKKVIEKLPGGTQNSPDVSEEADKIKEKIFPTISQAESEVLKSIIGQDKQVRKLLTAIYRSIYFGTLKSNILIIGNSGTGKTETVKQIASKLGLPYTIEDATQYTQEGYVGLSITDMISHLIQSTDLDLETANYDYETAEHGIIVVDEIDKKAGDDDDISGTKVLHSLLKIIEGTVVPIDLDGIGEPYMFDTSDLIIIFLGAFEGIDEIRDKRLEKNLIGFSSKTANEKTAEKSKSSELYTKEDLIEYGLPTEFVGRLDTIIQMNNLTVDDLVKILSSSNISVFSKYKFELERRGITLSYNENLFGKIAEKALSIGTGARELSNIVNKMFENILYDIFSNPGKFHFCEILDGILEDNTLYRLS